MAKSSGIGGTVVAIGVTLVGGYLTLVLLQRFMASNAQGQQQTNGLLQSILKALGKSGGAGKAGSSGSGGSAAKSSGGGLAGAIAAIKQSLADGEAQLQQINPFVDDTTLPLIDSQPIQSAFDVLGNDFGLDPSVFSGPSLDNSTDSAGGIPSVGSSAWDVLGNDFGLNPSSFSESDAAYLDSLGGVGGGGSGDYYGGGDYGFESYAPAYDSAF